MWNVKRVHGWTNSFFFSINIRLLRTRCGITSIEILFQFVWTRTTLDLNEFVLPLSNCTLWLLTTEKIQCSSFTGQCGEFDFSADILQLTSFSDYITGKEWWNFCLWIILWIVLYVIKEENVICRYSVNVAPRFCVHVDKI